MHTSRKCIKTIKKHRALVHTMFALYAPMSFSQSIMIQAFVELHEVQVMKEVWPRRLSEIELQQAAGTMAKRIRTMLAHVSRAHSKKPRPCWLKRALVTHLDQSTDSAMVLPPPAAQPSSSSAAAPRASCLQRPAASAKAVARVRIVAAPETFVSFDWEWHMAYQSTMSGEKRGWAEVVIGENDDDICQAVFNGVSHDVPDITNREMRELACERS